MPTVTTETRKRGVFGWIIAVLFWGWQALMAWGLISGFNNAARSGYATGSHADHVAYAAGFTIGVGLLLAFWLLGSLVLGLMMYFSRGRRVTTTREV